MSKKTLFGIFLALGIIVILTVIYSDVLFHDFDIRKIQWAENFYSKDTTTRLFFYEIAFLLISLIIVAVLFYLSGLFFGKKYYARLSKLEHENENLKKELDLQFKKIEQIKILYTGGKIAKKKNDLEEMIQNEPVIISSNPITQLLEVSEQEKETISPINQEKPSNQVKKDDLKVIEGIGPRIEYILNENNILTWKALSQETENHLKDILFSYGGSAYKIHDPSTWPEQALLANEEKWDDLKSLQEKLKDGKR